MANLTLFDVLTRNGNDALTGLVEEVNYLRPEFSNPVIVRAAQPIRRSLVLLFQLHSFVS